MRGQPASRDPHRCRVKVADLGVRLVSRFGSLSCCFRCDFIPPPLAFQGGRPDALLLLISHSAARIHHFYSVVRITHSSALLRCHPPAHRPDVIPLPSGFRDIAKSYYCHRLRRVPTATLMARCFLEVHSLLIASCISVCGFCHAAHFLLDKLVAIPVLIPVPVPMNLRSLRQC